MLLLLACAPATLNLGGTPDSPVPQDDSAGVISTEEGSCNPTGEPVWGVEGEELSVTLRCAGTGEADRFELGTLLPGAVIEGKKLVWTPELDQAGHYEPLILAFGPDGESRGSLDLWVADAWEARNNVPVDPATYEEEYGLPVLHLNRPQDTNEDEDVPATMTYRGETYDLGLKYRGAASAYYPKRSYSLYFPADHEFKDEKTGFPKRRGIVLTSTFDDNSYFRQRMCFDIWNTLDPSRHSIATQMVVVYVNGSYEGLYLLGDHIDGEYWEDQGLFEDGNLYKSVDHSANFYDSYGGRPKSSLHSGYEKKEGTPRDGEAGAYDDLDELVTWVVQSDATTFREELGDRLQVAQFMDWWILVRFTEADDSAGKNAYLYHDPAQPLWYFAPWDFNHALGQTWQTERQSADGTDEFRATNNLFRRMLEDAELSEELRLRTVAALDGPLRKATMDAQIDAYVAETWPSMTRDWERWGSEYRSYGGWSWRSDWTTPEEEVAYIRDWVDDRRSNLARAYR